MKEKLDCPRQVLAHSSSMQSQPSQMTSTFLFFLLVPIDFSNTVESFNLEFTLVLIPNTLQLYAIVFKYVGFIVFNLTNNIIALSYFYMYLLNIFNHLGR